MLRRIEVVPYDAHWRELFEAEVAQLRSILGREMVAAHHIGSTAIPGIVAKPIIDVLVEVRDIEEIDAFNHEMMAHGYIPRGEFGITGRRFFIKGTETERTHHIHVFEHREAGSHRSGTVRRHLAFRDYLRAHPEEAQAYSRLKEELAQQFRHDIEGYMAGKDDFIKDIERRALAWKKAEEQAKSA